MVRRRLDMDRRRKRPKPYTNVRYRPGQGGKVVKAGGKVAQVHYTRSEHMDKGGRWLRSTIHDLKTCRRHYRAKTDVADIATSLTRDPEGRQRRPQEPRLHLLEHHDHLQPARCRLTPPSPLRRGAAATGCPPAS